MCNYAPYSRPAIHKLAQGMVALCFFNIYNYLFYFIFLNFKHTLVILHIRLNDPGIQPLPS